MKTTIHTRLVLAAVGAALGALLLAGVSTLAGQRSSAAMTSVVDGSLRPLLVMQNIETELGAVRYRAAAALLDHYPMPPVAKHLAETRKTVESEWAQIEKRETTPAASDELSKELAMGYPKMRAVLDNLEKAYATGNRQQIDDVLQNEWPLAHKAFIKPLSAMADQQRAAAEATLAQAREAQRRDLLVTVALALLMSVVVGAAVIVPARSVVTGLREASACARAIAAGNLATPIETRRDDEVGAFFAALREMQGSVVQLVTGVRQTAGSLSLASTELATGNRDLGHRTEQQSSALEATVASMSQLDMAVKQNVANAQQASQLADGASVVAVKGGEVVVRVVDTMKGINDASKKIADIIGVIDSIAFQTNILALNAAVEAARAGDQGRGFAVVASEVRSLAQRSASAAKEIKGLISDSVERVEQGATLVDQAGQTMQEIVASIQRVAAIMVDINAASTEQNAGVARVGAAVHQMDQATQQNAALVDASVTAAQHLSQQAEQLVQTIAVFKLAQHELETAGA